MLVAASFFVFAQAGKDEQAVRQYFDELDAATRKDDFAAMERMTGDDFTYVGIAGMKPQSKAEAMEGARSRTFTVASGKRDIQSLRVMGDMAVVVSHVNFTGKYKDTGNTFNGAHSDTTVLAKRNGRWMRIATQFTRDMPTVDEKAVNQFVDHYISALLKNSPEAVEPFLGGRYVRVNADGTMTNKEQFLAALRSGDLKYVSIVADERATRTWDDGTVITTARVITKLTNKGADLSGTYRATTVLKRAAVDRHVVVSQHLTRIN